MDNIRTVGNKRKEEGSGEEIRGEERIGERR